ncbi:Trissin [Eumeta japonica]|uniref:Trissin n=1 Tax=Eumeta variegata TaxID=151549 RepID=A0A4C1T7P5_EUMVA|nr:Trissin [Eumeta japonica]
MVQIGSIDDLTSKEQQSLPSLLGIRLSVTIVLDDDAGAGAGGRCSSLLSDIQSAQWPSAPASTAATSPLFKIDTIDKTVQGSSISIFGKSRCPNTASYATGRRDERSRRRARGPPASARALSRSSYVAARLVYPQTRYKRAGRASCPIGAAATSSNLCRYNSTTMLKLTAVISLLLIGSNPIAFRSKAAFIRLVPIFNTRDVKSNFTIPYERPLVDFSKNFGFLATWSHADIRRNKRGDAGVLDAQGGGAWSGGLSCESCGSECAAACGTRHFRACCFNYLRKKRADSADALKSWRREGGSAQEKFEDHAWKKNPLFSIEDTIDPFSLKPVYTMKDFDPNSLEDMLQNRLQMIYDV